MLCAGAISEREVVAQFLILLLGGLGVSYTLDRWAGQSYKARDQLNEVLTCSL